MELQIIKQKHFFEKIIKEGKKNVNKNFVIYYLPSFFFGQNNTKIGISVGKKLGNAVTRNYYKRIIRQILRQADVRLDNKFVIIIIRPKIQKSNFNEIKKSLINILKELDEKK